MSHHQALVAKLQRNGRWLVVGSPQSINLTRSFGKRHEKAVTVTLEKEADGTYTLAPINYAFRSHCSHFDYTGEEYRWARNKGYIKSLINTLKEVGAWDFIKNKETFVQVNTHNPKANKAPIREQLQKIISKN